MAYIFLHNPKESDVSKIARTLAHKKTVQDVWSTGSRKTIPVDSLAIMFRTNTEPRRIIGYGVTIGPVKVNRPHWNEERGRTSNMVDIKFERLVDAETKLEKQYQEFKETLESRYRGDGGSLILLEE